MKIVFTVLACVGWYFAILFASTLLPLHVISFHLGTYDVTRGLIALVLGLVVIVKLSLK